MQEDDFAAEPLPSVQARTCNVTPACQTPIPDATPAEATAAPALPSPTLSAACHPSDTGGIGFNKEGLEVQAPTADLSPATPHPASPPSGSVGVTLVHKGQVVASSSWGGETLLGEVVRAWAQQHKVSVDTLWLRHASQDDYLADDVWLCDLAALAEQWGHAFVVKVCVPSEDEVPALTPSCSVSHSCLMR